MSIRSFLIQFDGLFRAALAGPDQNRIQTQPARSEEVVTDSSLNSASRSRELWPGLPLKEWEDTYATLHMWTPNQAMLDFMQSTYEAGANLAKWNGSGLERGE
jgi:hypothetical protein